MLLGSLSQPQWFVLSKPVSDFSPLKFLKRKEKRCFTSSLQSTTQISYLAGIHSTTSYRGVALCSYVQLLLFFFLFLLKMQSKSCFYEKRTVSIFVGQTAVITLISYALLFCPLKISSCSPFILLSVVYRPSPLRISQ